MNHEETIFEQALGIGSQQGREQFLRGACVGNQEMFERVQGLLRAHDRAGKFLEHVRPADGAFGVPPSGGAPPGPAEAGTPNLPLTEKPGDHIGRYKLLQKIGEGGCGVVYMAEQEEPVRRRVALKIIKLGMDTRQVIARFEAERQALALMDHPNIAKVFDAGATDAPAPGIGETASGRIGDSPARRLADSPSQLPAGRPYFVMELVRGVKITEYSDEKKLTTWQRLELFTQVCRAVQHAHQKGIIHRDLKPSNILVSFNDGVAVPKVIDFGIAKATTGEPLTDKTVFTAFEQFIGTPAYMSPEQALVTSLDIDTRTDIYALGVLLYELLTGHTPFDPKELMQAGLDEMRRTIREKEPERPSTRLTGLVAADVRKLSSKSEIRNPKSEIERASSRRLLQEKERLVSQLRGDLDWIVMKCLEKDRTRRYETANGLASDIQRYLNNEPVVARPPSNLYRFQKMVRRNKLLFASAGAVVAALLIGLGFSTLMFIRERHAARRANAEEKKAEHEAEKSAQEATRARRAEADSYLAQANARRWSSRVGRRAEALEALKKAAAIRPNLELRNEAIACMALTDVRPGRLWEGPQARCSVGFDSAYERYVLVCPSNNVIRIRRVKDDAELMQLSGYSGTSELEFPILQFSPEGRWLAVGHGIMGHPRKLDIWDLKRKQVSVEFPQRDCRCVSFNADGHLAAISFADTNRPIVIYDLIAKETVATFDHGTLPWSLQFHPVKKQLAISSEESDEVQIWDIERGAVVQKLPHPETVVPIAWSPEGDLLASGCADNQVYLWDVAKAKPIHVLPGHSGFPRAVSFSFDGQFLTSRGWDGTLRFWDPWTGQLTFKLPVTGFSLGFGQNDYRYCYNARDGVAFYEIEPSYECRLLRPGWALGARGQACDFSSDGQLLLTAHEDGVRLWNPARGKVLAFLPDSHTHCAIFERRENHFLVSGVGGVKEWSFASEADGKLRVRGPMRKVSEALPGAMMLSHDGSVLEFSVGTNIHVMNLTNGVKKLLPGLVKLPSEQSGSSLFTALSPDGRLVACGVNCQIDSKGCPVRVFDASTSEVLAELPQQSGSRPLFSPNGKWLVTGDALVYRLWEVGTWKEVSALSRGDAGYFAFMDFSPDSSMLALAMSRDTVWLVEATSGHELARLEAPEAHDIYDIQFSPDGSQLAVLYRHGPMHLWNLNLIRQQLAAMKLDWDLPPLPSRAAAHNRDQSR